MFAVNHSFNITNQSTVLGQNVGRLRGLSFSIVRVLVFLCDILIRVLFREIIME